MNMLGYFLPRNDLLIKKENLQQELRNHLFEANIMKLAIEHLLARKITSIDPSVGDWKCQVRASMIIDLARDVSLAQSWADELSEINHLCDKIQSLLDGIKIFTIKEHQQLDLELKESTLYEFFKKNKLCYIPSTKLAFLGLCFLTTFKNYQMPIFVQYQVSVNKMKAFINQAKMMLCHLSIAYEKDLAKKYCDEDEQIALQQIESKAVQCMTSLFVGFMPIYKKMKQNKESMIINYVKFCICGGVQATDVKLFQLADNQFDKNINFQELNQQELDQAIMAIKAYQFPGSLMQLQNVLGISNEELGIRKEYLRPCRCSCVEIQKTTELSEEGIMAFFAQHPQFINDVEIDFQGLGLLGSDLKKNYDDLLTLGGFSRHDMSKFFILHMGPSTLAEALHSDDESYLGVKLPKYVPDSIN